MPTRGVLRDGYNAVRRRVGFFGWGFIFIEPLRDLLVKPIPHIQRSRVNFFIVRNEANRAILHDVFQSTSNGTLQA